MICRVLATAGQEGVEDAGFGCSLELNLLTVFIILFQERTVNVAADIVLVISPILLGQLSGNALQLIADAAFLGSIVLRLQHRRDRLQVVLG